MKKFLNALKHPLAKLPGRGRGASDGFSLIEMLIVIALMALVGTFAVSNIMRRFEEAKASSTRVQLNQVKTILDDFRRVCGFYPTTEQGLDALVKAPAGRECKNYDPEGFVKRVPKDGWDREFLYESDGNKVVIKSLGGDGQVGGDGYDKDLSSED